MAFRVSKETRGERTVYRLHDDGAGSSASVLPSFGFNLFDLRLPAANRVRSMVVAEPDWSREPRNPGRNGVPVLFPFPNRVREGRFQFQGKEYQLPINSAPHAIHGFALSAPWDVVEHKATGTEASITGRFQISKNAPGMLAHWPTDAVLQIRYALSGRRLEMTIQVSNPTGTDLPYGFGIHPYFPLPFTPDGDRTRTRVVVPASKYWVLEGYIPTGEVRPVNDRLDFRDGQPIQGLKLDDVLTGLDFQGDRAVCKLVDLDLGAEFHLSFGRGFRELVMFTPPGPGNAIALEPYTQTTDALNLQPRGVDAGLRVLRHGGEDTFSITMETVG